MRKIGQVQDLIAGHKMDFCKLWKIENVRRFMLFKTKQKEQKWDKKWRKNTGLNESVQRWGVSREKNLLGECVALRCKYIFWETTKWLGRKRTCPIAMFSRLELLKRIIQYCEILVSTAGLYLTCLLCNKALWSVDCAVNCIIRTFRSVATCSCNAPIFIRNPPHWPNGSDPSWNDQSEQVF